MLTACDQCGKKYNIDPSKIKGQSARFKCKDCGHVISVSKGGPADSMPMPPPAKKAGKKKTKRTAREKKKAKSGTKGMSIKTKITLIIVLLVLVSLGAVGFLAIFQSKNSLSEQAEKHLLRMATQKSREYGQVFIRIKEELEGVAAYSKSILERRDITIDTGFRKYIIYGPNGVVSGDEERRREAVIRSDVLRVQRIGRVLENQITNNPYLSLGYISIRDIGGSSVTVFDDERMVEEIRKVKEFHPHKRVWFVNAKKSGKTVWTPPYVDVATGKFTITCATPIYLTDSSFAGVLGYDILLNTIQKDVLSLDIGYDSYAFLVRRDGTVLVRPDVAEGNLKWDSTYKADNLLETNNKEYNAIIRKMTQGGTGIETFKDETGDRYVAFAPIREIGSSMGIVAKKKSVIAPAIKTQWYILYACILVLLVAVVIGIFIGNGITKPINELTTMANLISQGKMDLNVLEEERTDEIGVLTKSFNRLVISLKLAMSK